MFSPVSCKTIVKLIMLYLVCFHLPKNNQSFNNKPIVLIYENYNIHEVYFSKSSIEKIANKS